MTDRAILSSITRPGRYLGHEYNAYEKNWQSAAIRFALVFPDLYEIGMSHQGLQILYHLLNGRKEFLADRCYCPDIDLEQMLRRKKAPLTSLESAHPLADFDVLGITLPYELCYTNILTILDLAAIPCYARDRDNSMPLLLGGGACSLNPEPVADFFDAILLGDGEEAIMEIAELLAAHKQAAQDKRKLLELLEGIDGVYIPAHFEPQYHKDGTFCAIRRIGGKKDHIHRRIVADLNPIEHLKHPLVPNAKIVHDRMGIEVARGCTRGCRFCQAGITYRPVRERSPEKIIELAESGLAASGFEELALLSLSTGDYSCLEQVLPQLMDSFTERFVSVAMPSMRVGTLTPKIMEQVKRVRKTGFTLAPEAGSERLRRVINKGITEDDLIATCKEAFALGWRVIKFYFMIGLPTEIDQDIEAIIDLVKKAMAMHGGGRPGKGKKQITVSIGTFVPKPHTPFQWAAQLSIEESTRRIRHLQSGLPKGCNLRYHSPQISYLEGVFSRGDRRLARLLELAWQAGARLDGWDEHFSLARWQKTAELCGIDIDDFLRARTLDEPLPWQHLHTGVEQQFLKDELAKAEEQIYTPDCRYHACQKCGLCDFKTLMPVVYNRRDKSNEIAVPQAPQPAAEAETSKLPIGAAGHFKYLVHYSRIGEICFLGHLEILQMIFRTLRRAGIATNYSQGFNPSPKISFGPALPVGTESLAEYFIMDLPEPLGSQQELQAVMARINDKLAPGLQVHGIELHSGKIAQKISVTYELTLPSTVTETERIKAAEFVAAENYIINKTRKGKTTTIDIRPLISTFSIDASAGAATVRMEMISASAEPGIKPMEALSTILDLDEERSGQTKIIKTNWYSLD